MINRMINRWIKELIKMLEKTLEEKPRCAICGVWAPCKRHERYGFLYCEKCERKATRVG